MPAVALTDHANMMGSFRFINEINQYNKQIKIDNSKLNDDENDKIKSPIKPILGCEFFKSPPIIILTIGITLTKATVSNKLETILPIAINPPKILSL